MSTNLPMVGREAELAALREAAASAAAGRGALLLVGGAAGMGKTALLRQLAQGASALLTAIGRCPGEHETPPFGPWREAVAELTAAQPQSVPPPFTDGGAWQPPAETAAQLLLWLRSLPQPVLLILEDLHWADPASLELLRQIAPRVQGAPLLIAATYRSDELNRDHPLWALLPELGRSGAVRQTLAPLTRAEVAQLAAAMGEPEAADRVYDRTGGHPLFTRELLLAGAPAALPESVQQIIDVKLRRLSPEALAVAQAAAVIGEQFGYDLLFRVTQLPEDHLLQCLEEAIALRIIWPDGGSPDQFRFDHALVREAVLSPLIGPRRRRWHIRTAEALMGMPQPDLDAVALHLARAHDPRAADFLLPAGDKALQMGALEDAGSRYEQALTLLPADDARRAELLLKLGHSVYYPDPERARQCWEEAEQAGDPPVRAWVRHMLALWRYRWGGQLDGMAAVQEDQAQLLADERFQRLERDLFGTVCGYPRIAVIRATALVLAGRQHEVQALLADLQAALGTGSGHADLLLIEACLAYVNGEMPRANRLWRQLCAARLERRQYRLAMLAALERLGQLLVWWRADLEEEAEAACEQVRELEVLARDRAGFAYLPEGYSVLGFYHYLRGDWEQARHHLVTYLARHPADGSNQLRCFAVHLQLASGELAGAEELLGPMEPRRLEDGPGKNLQDCSALLLRAKLRLATGEPEEARQWLEATERWVAAGCGRPVQCDVAVNWAEFHLQTGDLAAAQDWAERGLALALELEASWLTIIARRLLGQIAVAQGRPGAAVEHWDLALAMAERCRFPYELALTRLARGRRDDLQAARAVFERLGAKPALARAERALAALGQEEADSPLTAREVAVLRLVAAGLTDKEVAARLYISPRTVEHHLANMAGKLGVRGRAALVASAARLRLLDEALPGR